ncbi:hypothetical protein FQN50_004747 [Emmonsiellopsis sp. PD_5]|nr:hypothetical protein FQN50_004747 [Emmonsiellopsis sp. PD_5]
MLRLRKILERQEKKKKQKKGGEKSAELAHQLLSRLSAWLSPTQGQEQRHQERYRKQENEEEEEEEEDDKEEREKGSCEDDMQSPDPIPDSEKNDGRDISQQQQQDKSHLRTPPSASAFPPSIAGSKRPLPSPSDPSTKDYSNKLPRLSELGDLPRSHFEICAPGTLVTETSIQDPRLYEEVCKARESGVPVDLPGGVVVRGCAEGVTREWEGNGRGKEGREVVEFVLQTQQAECGEQRAAKTGDVMVGGEKTDGPVNTPSRGFFEVVMGETPAVEASAVAQEEEGKQDCTAEDIIGVEGEDEDYMAGIGEPTPEELEIANEAAELLAKSPEFVPSADLLFAEPPKEISAITAQGSTCEGGDKVAAGQQVPPARGNEQQQLLGGGNSANPPHQRPQQPQQHLRNPPDPMRSKVGKRFGRRRLVKAFPPNETSIPPIRIRTWAALPPHPPRPKVLLPQDIPLQSIEEDVEGVVEESEGGSGPSGNGPPAAIRGRRKAAVAATARILRPSRAATSRAATRRGTAQSNMTETVVKREPHTDSNSYSHGEDEGDGEEDEDGDNDEEQPSISPSPLPPRRKPNMKRVMPKRASRRPVDEGE